jgi:hypothetical protein
VTAAAAGQHRDHVSALAGDAFAASSADAQRAAQCATTLHGQQCRHKHASFDGLQAAKRPAHSEFILASKGRAKRHGGILCSSATSPALARTHGRASGIRTVLCKHEEARLARAARAGLDAR